MNETQTGKPQAAAPEVWELSAVAHAAGDLAYVRIPAGNVGGRGHTGQTEWYYVVAGKGWLVLEIGDSEVVRLLPGVER